MLFSRCKITMFIRIWQIILFFFCIFSVFYIVRQILDEHALGDDRRRFHSAAEKESHEYFNTTLTTDRADLHGN